jgi:hypothetical protein
MPIYSILRQEKGEAAVLDLLQKTYEHIMGIVVPPEKLRDIAQKFLQIDVGRDEILH